jgi:thiamine biosynthesis lipoprotein
MLEVHDHAMGSRVHLMVASPDDSLTSRLARYALDRISELELRWSRFLPDSDIGRANATRGIPVDVTAETRLLVKQAIRAWELTSGLYDPTVLDALVAAGYDRDLTEIRATRADAERHQPHRAPGCTGIEIDDGTGTITLPLGVGFDPGGIGKGLAADLVAEELSAAGATTALVSIGGDVRMVGVRPDDSAWIVQIDEPAVSSTPIARVALTSGAVATSTDRRRTWTVGRDARHHVIDPRTGDCADSSAQLVTVLAADAWWAEVLATQLMLTHATERQDAVGADAALVIDRDGRHHHLGRMGDHIR